MLLYSGFEMNWYEALTKAIVASGLSEMFPQLCTTKGRNEHKTVYRFLGYQACQHGICSFIYKAWELLTHEKASLTDQIASFELTIVLSK